MSCTSPDRLAGVLLGTAVGDALGLPAEGLRPAVIRRLGWTGDWHHRFLGRGGMWSDDTEHTVMLAQALLASGDDPARFARAFAWELRWWILGLPAGVGLATARSIVRLWLGFSPERSGVFSAGNGPCMRAAVVGACHAGDPEKRRLLTAAQTRLTHTDPKALTAAMAVTELAALLSTRDTPPDPEEILAAITPEDPDLDWQIITRQLKSSWATGGGLSDFLAAIGGDPARGISGYAYHTVPAVVFAGVRHDWDFRITVSAILDAGGDTDTAGAVAGALCGAFGGESGIPPEWITGIWEWPTGVSRLRRLAKARTDRRPVRIRPRWSPFLLLRNLVFLTVVLFHGFARLFRFLLPTRIP